MPRIARVHAFAVGVPLLSPVKMAGIEIRAADNLIVRIEDDAGRVGWGEAASAPTMTGEFPEGMVAAARFFAAAIEGRGFDTVEEIGPLLAVGVHANHGPRAAVECALLDLLAQATGAPMHALLGGRRRAAARVLAMVAGGAGADEIADARARAEAGYRAFKVKVGVNPPERDLDRARKVRDALGPDVTISADANQGFSREDALVFVRGAADAGLDFVEQPVAAGDLDGMAACVAASAVPIAADEAIHGAADIRRLHAAGAADGGSLKTIKFGGCLPVMGAGALMAELGMRVNLAGKVAETSIASAATAHLAVALPTLDWDVSVTNAYLADDVAEAPIAAVGGAIAPPDRPGLGIVPDEARLARRRTIG